MNKQRREETFGHRLPGRWMGQPAHPRFEKLIREALDRGIESARVADIPPSREWYQRNSRKGHKLSPHAGGNKGLNRAMRGIREFLSVNYVLNACKGAGIADDHESVRCAIMHLAKSQRLLLQACVWLHDEDVRRLANLEVPGDYALAWSKAVHGAMATAAVAKALILSGIDVRYPNPETDVLDGTDLLVPNFLGWAPLAVQVKSMRRRASQILSILNPRETCMELDASPDESRLMEGLVYATFRKVTRLNRRLGTSYVATLAIVGGLNPKQKPMSEAVDEIRRLMIPGGRS